MNWKTVEEDREAWANRPNAIELLYPDGTIRKFVVYGNAAEATLKFDGLFTNELATHWRPLKKDKK